MATSVSKRVLSVAPVTGAIGAVVDGVDLHDPLDDETAQALRDAINEHSVLFFHGQDLSEDEQLAFASTFGPVGQYPLAKMLGGTAMSSIIEDTADSPPDADGWHTDVTWIAEPPQVAVLSARVVPEVGGDTLWASMTAAYEALSPTMRSLCAGLTVRHHRGDEFDAAVGRFLDDEQMAKLAAAHPPVEHPLVRTHPRTGRQALFLSGLFMDQIVELSRAESDALLGFLTQHAADPNFQVRWTWTANDPAVWDERCTNHRALSDHYPQHRVMRCVTVDGERPAYVQR
jgi:taurine dioxygenase